MWLIATAGSNPAATATIVSCEPWSRSDQGSFVAGSAGAVSWLFCSFVRFFGCASALLGACGLAGAFSWAKGGVSRAWTRTASARPVMTTPLSVLSVLSVPPVSCMPSVSAALPASLGSFPFSVLLTVAASPGCLPSAAGVPSALCPLSVFVVSGSGGLTRMASKKTRLSSFFRQLGRGGRGGRSRRAGQGGWPCVG